ncbi:MAG: hypothetical protein PUG33_04885 [Mollicutes bacterium]|nr:hypothetical protein [Mollicutes bacterium]MDY5874730.1 hypothetical protein [Bacilli bacterium]
MTNLFQIGAIDSCGGLLPIVRVIRKGVFPLVQLFIPIILIILGTIDLGKAVIASDDKEVKAAQGRLIKRFIYAALIFFVTTLVSVLMDLVSKGGDDAGDTTSWQSCWRSASN